MAALQMPGRRCGATVRNKLSTRKIDDKVLALMVAVAIVAAFMHFDPLGVVRPLESAEVVGCDGRFARLDGRTTELLRLHNEARAELGLGQFCVQDHLIAAAQGDTRRPCSGVDSTIMRPQKA
jgi:hypothetical protein